METVARLGAYAVSFSVNIPNSAHQSDLSIVLDIEVESGEIGASCVSQDYSSFVDLESVATAGPGRRIYVGIGSAGAAKHFVLRNASREGVSVARVYGVDLLPRDIDDELFGDLDELGWATAKDAPLPFLFCVVSWGAAATNGWQQH